MAEGEGEAGARGTVPLLVIQVIEIGHRREVGKKVPDTFLVHEARMAAASIPVPDTSIANIGANIKIVSLLFYFRARG